MTKPTCRPIATSMLLALAPSWIGCGGPSNGFSSPQACFAAMKKAVNEKDIAGMCDCITDDSQTALTGILVVAGSMMRTLNQGSVATTDADTTSQQAAATISAVLNKHGATEAALHAAAANLQSQDPNSIRALASLVPDKKAFIVDMYGATQQLNADSQFSKQLEEQVDGQLKDVLIDADKASAAVVTASGDVPIQFRRIGGGGWKLQIIDLDAMAAQRDAASTIPPAPSETEEAATK